VTVRRVGNQKHYQANASAPIFEELRGLVLKTSGLVDVLRAAPAPLAAQIDQAFVYGSVAKGKDTAKSDIDFMVISEKLAYADLLAALEPATNRLQRPVNSTLYSRMESTNELQIGNCAPPAPTRRGPWPSRHPRRLQSGPPLSGKRGSKHRQTALG
jgi:predicted nucleotidyltransferase